MKKGLLIVALLCSYFVVSAQDDYRNGYIIMPNDSLVFGQVNFRDDMRNSKECTFKSKSNDNKTYSPNDIKGYRFTNGKYYVSKYVKAKGNVNHLFVEYLVEGDKSLYYYRDMGGNHFLIDYKNDTLIEIPYREEIVNIGGINYLKEPQDHKKILKAYFRDCPAMFSKIDQLNRPYFDNLVNITKEYYHLTCGDSGCTVYYKPKPLFKIAVEPQYGVSHFSKYLFGNSSYQTNFGVNVYLWLPRSNENLYIKTGLTSYSQDFTLIKIPIQLEYVFPYRTFKPKVDFGFNYYRIRPEGMGLNTALAVGVLIKASDYMYFDFSAEADLFNMSYGSKLLLLQAATVGLYLKF